MTCLSKLLTDLTSESGDTYASLHMESNPPFQNAYKTLFQTSQPNEEEKNNHSKRSAVVGDGSDLPLIDLSRLSLSDGEKEACKRQIVDASAEWGFFQVKNHGISREILEKIRHEQNKLFLQPFEKKATEKVLDFSADCYRWGTPTATSLRQFSWSEAFHIPLVRTTDAMDAGEFSGLRSTMEEFAAPVSDLAHRLAEILAENLGHKSNYFMENCSSSTCFLRLNRYPACPISSDVYGLMPHTDSDFITILYQDQVGGLQLLKDGRWITVKPNSETLIVNIGDLFQAWSNGAYKSVEHRVMTNTQAERYSIAYFMCPSYDTVIESCIQPSMYRKFSFREYRQQVQDDVRTIGSKVGLPRFLI
ncbi:gibberellin 2-beta-dioxygenase 8 isoform X2 [Magnolia sinica]|uniref:gibberellin 2-beta-dioxygenase 8 isoform X2 n=1 Tax=Magnolia sinica TaxID=86752 RepID=UPI00265856B8|nr:gibberellin 2-beta-dioxygenase 8 isoform X2 [Magnolia sinica]